MNKATDLASLPLEGTDILEDDIMRVSPQLLAGLLRDHTTGKNIMWATNDYAALGPGYAFCDEITPERITGEHGRLIMPRIYKSKDVQTERKKDKAEIFTPSWMGKCFNTVNLYAANRVQPLIAVLYQIADILEVDVRELLVASKV